MQILKGSFLDRELLSLGGIVLNGIFSTYLLLQCTLQTNFLGDLHLESRPGLFQYA